MIEASGASGGEAGREGGEAAAGDAASGSRTRAALHAVAAVPARLVGGFWSGFRYPLRGARFVYLQHPGLVRIWIFPVLLTLATLLAAGWLAVDRHEQVAAWLWSDPEGEAWWQVALGWVHGLYEVLVLLVLLLLALVAAVVLSNVFAAPFNDALSERVETLVTGRQPPPFSWGRLLRDLLGTVVLEVAKLLLYLVVMGPAWLLSLLVPLVGPVLYAVFGFFFTAGYFALDYVDYAAARAGLGVGRRLGLLRRRTAPMLGFGTGCWALLLVPLVNLLLMPAAVAGGTLLFLDLAAEEEGGGEAERGEPPHDG